MRTRERLERLERQFDDPYDFIDGGGGGVGPSVIRVRGGVPGEEGKHASVGGLRFRREPGEDQMQFENRMIDVAIQIGQRWVVFGALPDWSGDE
jgi:hypothetical protein